MKTISTHILLLVIAAAAFLSCSREEQVSPQHSLRGNAAGVDITFIADGTAVTRTALGGDGLSVLWTGNEHITVWDGTKRNDFSTTDAGENASFSGSVSGGASKFYALYPYSNTTAFSKSGEVVAATISLPATQTAVRNSFPEGANIAAAYTTDSDRLHFHNLVSAARLTLSSANLGGHSIASISIAGSHPMTGAAVVRWDSEGEAEIAPAATGTVNNVTISAGGYALADGEYSLSILPNAGGEITLTFIATDNYSATVNASVSSFKAGTIKNLGTVKGLTWKAPAVVYTKVTSDPANWAGRYLIVYEEGNVAFDGSLSTLDATNNTKAVTINSNTVTLAAASNLFYFDIASNSGSNYSIRSASGYYIGRNNNSNGLDSDKSTEYSHTLSISDNSANIRSNGGAYLKFNKNSGQERFRYYTSNQQPIQLYKQTGTIPAVNLPDTTPSIDPEPPVGGGGTVDPLQYLHCYEMPAVSLANTSTYTATGSEVYNTYGDYPWYRYATTNSKQMIVSHTYRNASGTLKRLYTSLVDKDRRSPIWNCAAYHADYYPSLIERVDNWRYDPAIGNDWQQSGIPTTDVNKYSLGHLTASADRRENADASKMTTYYTNQVPQWQDGFNSGVWSALEEAVRNAAPSNRDTLYVVNGPLYEGTIQYLTSKDSKSIPIPSHMYKCIMYCSFNASGECTGARGVAYVYTNESHSGQNFRAAAFESTIDAIETRAGFDFFANVPAAYQNAAENGSSRLSL